MSSSKGDDQFRQEYAMSLADALQERADLSKDDLVHDAYVALCHDDPHVDSDDACRLLANALTKDDSHYRLSERLVEGVRQATCRTVTNGPTGASTKEEEEEDNDGELVWRTRGVATAAGYATLAFTCFVKIPLHCCQSSEMAVLKDRLGSYRGPKRRQKDNAGSDSREAERSFDDERVNEVAQGLSAMGQHDSDDSSNDKKSDELSLEEEVWAAESDPSDFEYESSYDPQQAFKELEQWTEAFDPVALSKPPPSTDWDNLRQGVANLLSELSYSKLAPLSKQQWNSLRVSNLLSQLTLTLLIQPENASAALLDDELQQLGIQPLFVMRDRVASHSGALGEYLTLVQTLVAVDAAAPIPSTSLAPATVVGLGALSALCHVSHHGINSDAPQRMRQCVLETSEDLAHVMEKLRSDSSTIHVMWTLLSLLDRLTNVRPDGTLWESSSLTNEDAQLLLQSGMFRELILLIKEESAARTQLLRSLQIMCVQSPSLLGKYAWRVPDLAKIVQTNEFAQEHVVDGLVWNLLGTSLAGGAVRLGLKNMPVVTVDLCRARSMNSFERLCQDAEKTMNVVQLLRTGNDAEDDGWKEPIQELSRFSNYLVSCPSLAVLWRNAASMDDVTMKRVNSAVGSLRNVLSSLARIPESPVGKMKTDKSADNDKAGDPLERPKAYGEHEEACIRKAIKIVSVSWQPPSRQGREMLSSKTD
jgi:hypothetical protein